MRFWFYGNNIYKDLTVYGMSLQRQSFVVNSMFSDAGHFVLFSFICFLCEIVERLPEESLCKSLL